MELFRQTAQDVLANIGLIKEEAPPEVIVRETAEEQEARFLRLVDQEVSKYGVAATFPEVQENMKKIRAFIGRQGDQLPIPSQVTKHFAEWQISASEKFFTTHPGSLTSAISTAPYDSEREGNTGPDVDLAKFEQERTAHYAGTHPDPELTNTMVELGRSLAIAKQRLARG